MNYKLIANYIGNILRIEGLFMIPALLVSLYHNEFKCVLAFGISIAALLVIGQLMHMIKPKKRNIFVREGFAIVSLSWLAISLFGALPFFISREIPNFIDCFFETVSGLTTTGSSILSNVEALSKGLLYWRSFSHWLGGMGVLVFLLAVVPNGKDNDAQSLYILRAESPGPTFGKLVSKMRQTAQILYIIYIALTIIEIILLFAGGMPLFDTLCNAFATAGTGGFAIKADSFAGYSYYHQTVTTVFMALFGVNFSIYFFILRRKFDLVWKNTELRWYLAIIFLSIAAITLNILPMYPRACDALHHAAFSVSSVITTTGFGTENFGLWPEFSRVILVLLMLIGACAGSTGGGLKISRLVILVKTVQREVRLLLHPRTVKVMTIDGKPLSNDTVRGVSAYFLTYVFLIVISILLVSLDGFDGSTTITAVFATVNNIGPGLGMVDPAGSYAAFSPLAKVVLTLDMLFGRLELYPMLILMLPTTWTRRR